MCTFRSVSTTSTNPLHDALTKAWTATLGWMSSDAIRDLADLARPRWLASSKASSQASWEAPPSSNNSSISTWFPLAAAVVAYPRNSFLFTFAPAL